MTQQPALGDPELDEVARFLAIRKDIDQRIADSAVRVGRDPDSVHVVAVTKAVPAERIRAAIAAGFRTLGENRVQERLAKAAELDAATPHPELDSATPHPEIEPDADAPRWHLVGPLQSNKARRALELFDVIETVDSLDLARRLDRLEGEVRPGHRLPVLVQVNVDADPAKAGFEPAILERELAAIHELPNLHVEGLMTVGRLGHDPENARPTFVALRRLSERLRAAYPTLGAALSMGMTDDYPVAVEEGATLVRIGRAIFGARPTR